MWTAFVLLPVEVLNMHNFPLFIYLNIHCVSKEASPTFSTNLKTNYQILIIFGINISHTTCYQMTIQLLTSPNVCFCTTWGKDNKWNVIFYPMRYDCVINICVKTHFVSISDTLADILSSCPFFNSSSKIARTVGPLCEHRQGDAFSIHWQQYR